MAETFTALVLVAVILPVQFEALELAPLPMDVAKRVAGAALENPRVWRQFSLADRPLTAGASVLANATSGMAVIAIPCAPAAPQSIEKLTLQGSVPVGIVFMSKILPAERLNDATFPGHRFFPLSRKALTGKCALLRLVRKENEWRLQFCGLNDQVVAEFLLDEKSAPLGPHSTSIEHNKSVAVGQTFEAIVLRPGLQVWADPPADIATSLDALHRLRLEPMGTVQSPAFAAQLQWKVEAIKGHEYKVSGTLRADRRRTCLLTYSQAHSPWENLGLSQQLDATPEGATFAAAFRPSRTDADAMFVFNLGGNDAPLTVEDLAFERDGRRQIDPRTSLGQSIKISIAETPNWVALSKDPSLARILARDQEMGQTKWRVESTSGVPVWSATASWEPFPVAAGCEIRARFRVRSETVRSLTCSLSQAAAPWRGLGADRRIKVSTTWSDVDLRFRPMEGEQRARLALHLGGEQGEIQISDPWLTIANHDLKPPMELANAAATLRPVPVAQNKGDLTMRVLGDEIEFTFFKKFSTFVRFVHSE